MGVLIIKEIIIAAPPTYSYSEKVNGAIPIRLAIRSNRAYIRYASIIKPVRARKVFQWDL